jgi:hypothetical protein
MLVLFARLLLKVFFVPSPRSPLSCLHIDELVNALRCERTKLITVVRALQAIIKPDEDGHNWIVDKAV